MTTTMTTATPPPVAPAGDHHSLAIVLFAVIVLVTLGVTLWVGRQGNAAEDFYAGGRDFTPLQNGFALSGDYLSAASFLGVAGLIALYGYDGVLYSIGFLVAWLVVLMLVAELVRNAGRYTLADVLALRLRRRKVRAAAGGASVVVTLLYLVAQMVGAGSLVALLLGTNSPHARTWTIIAVGALMIVYVTIGGMRATTWIQIIKAVLLVTGSVLLTVLLLVHFHGDLGELMRQAAQHSGAGHRYLEPGLKYGAGFTSRLDFFSLGLALVLGTAGLPHILSRFYTVPTARAARRSTMWAIGLVGGFYLMAIALGLGATALVGSAEVRHANPAGNTAVPLLALVLGGGNGSTGGVVLFALISAIAFATILAVVAGLTLASSAAFAHDIWAGAWRNRPRRERTPSWRGRLRRRPTEALPAARSADEPGLGSSEQQEVVVARIAAVGIGAAAIVISLYAQQLNVAFLVGLAFAVAASANLPVLLYTLFWSRFTARGAVWSVYGGLVPAMVLVLFSPVVSGSKVALFPGVDFHWFPLENPGIISIPLGFLAGWIGTITSPEPADADRFAELEVRALTGAGAA
ncbi:cation/acetate symporter [Streptomyces sp. 1114.5]|uniref:solute symporter family protein n=1 Tax=unclassified Streptomyces TaxID=2593676 RepID=UPI000BC75BDB|nr:MULTISPECIES: cation acetate symporter [unclassified Streptomyces]RKT10879.1 cation/acetate symporter [Streptomyces sp. 1114.5]SOB81785.1 cation/acetate symporter [Streptomyces sp. 1331.2]